VVDIARKVRELHILLTFLFLLFLMNILDIPVNIKQKRIT
jgi:hypothetical protein